MNWFENTPAGARLALSVGGAFVASQANLLPPSFQLVALGTGIALCCYGIAASMRAPRKSETWLEDEMKKDFERQQTTLMHKFRNLDRAI